MNYQHLITQTLTQFDLNNEDVYSMVINFDAQTITVLTVSFAKYVRPFPDPDDDDEYNQDPEPRPKRKTMVKRPTLNS